MSDETTRWDDLLSNHPPREDREAPFPPDLLEDDAPVLLSALSDQVAALVASRVLEIVASRAGAHHTPSTYSALRRRVERAVPDHVRVHADEEAWRVLDWLSRPVPPADDRATTRQLEAMGSADLETRARIVRLAMDEQLELELEYHDPVQDVWDRIRAAPEDLDEIEGELCLVARLRGDSAREIPLATIRWLMPVQPRGDIVHREEPQVATVLSFPFGSE